MRDHSTQFTTVVATVEYTSSIVFLVLMFPSHRTDRACVVVFVVLQPT